MDINKTQKLCLNNNQKRNVLADAKLVDNNMTFKEDVLL